MMLFAYRFLRASLLVPLLAAAPRSPQAIELVTGEVLIGEVVEVSDDFVRMEIDYPETEARKIPRDRIRPRSMFEILAARTDPKSADALRDLAKDAAGLGLPGHAIASLRAASRVDVAGQPQDELEVRRIRDSIAEEIVEQAQASLDVGNEAAARLDARFVVESLADTTSRKAAERILEEVEARRRNVDELDHIDAERTRELLESVEEELRAAERQELFTGTHAASIDAEHRQRAEAAVDVLETVWKPLQRHAPRKTVDAQLERHYRNVRDRVRDDLVAHYLALGRIKVQLGALPDAAELNEKACSIDPDSEECARLQRLIVQARLYDGWR